MTYIKASYFERNAKSEIWESCIYFAVFLYRFGYGLYGDRMV